MLTYSEVEGLSREQLKVKLEEYIGSIDTFWDGYKRPLLRQARALYFFLQSGNTRYPLFGEVGTGKTKVALDLARACGSQRLLYVTGGTNGMVEAKSQVVRHFDADTIFNLVNAETKGEVYDADVSLVAYKSLLSETFCVDRIPRGNAVKVKVNKDKVEEFYHQQLKSPEFLLLDEWHTVKQKDTVIFSIIMELSRFFKHVIMMSGTPVYSNNINGNWAARFIDLYSVFKISNPKLTFREFTNRFKFVKHKLQFGSVWNLPDSSDLEKELRRISVIWVDKREVPAVKEHIQISLFRMSSEQRKLYERSYHSARQLSSGFVTKKKRGVTTMQPVATVKTRMLQEIAQQLILLNEKLIVVTEYIGSQQVVLETLKDYKPLLIKAGMSFYEMERVIKDFENTYPILVIAVKVGALSSNLQFCNNMVFYDIPSSEINYVQMVGRIKRPIGQNDDVYLYFLAATFEANRLLSMFKGVDAASQGIYGTTRNYHNLRRKVRVWI